MQYTIASKGFISRQEVSGQAVTGVLTSGSKHLSEHTCTKKSSEWGFLIFIFNSLSCEELQCIFTEGLPINHRKNTEKPSEALSQKA